MSAPFSFNDPPGKNVRDGLVVMVGALVLMLFTAGEWLDAFFVSLWGIFVCIGFGMIVVGCVRAIRQGLQKSKKAPPASKRRRGLFEALSHSFENHRKVVAAEGQPVSSTLVGLWFLSCILGPPIGWLLTSNVFFDITDARAPHALLLRAALTIPLQTLAGGAITITYRAPATVKVLFAAFVTGLSALSVWSGFASARDLIAGGVQSEVVTVAEYQSAGYFGAPWNDARQERPLNYGSFHARLADGREMSFYCTPVCLTYWSDNRNKEEWAGGKSVRMYYLQHRQVILRFEPVLSE